jgi:hypothetical protein
MSHYVEAGRLSALLVIIAGLLICFWGYRILKLSLAIIGFTAGAFGGWQLGLSLANSSTLVVLVCAFIGGALGMLVCLWLYFVGIFLVGATAGTVAAAAFSSGTGHRLQPIVLFALPLAFGVIALVAQKLMIIISTAVSGAYLIMAGIWPFVANNPNASGIWLFPGQNNTQGTLGYGALLFWALLALLGVASQRRTSLKTTKPEVQQK